MISSPAILPWAKMTSNGLLRLLSRTRLALTMTPLSRLSSIPASPTSSLTRSLKLLSSSIFLTMTGAQRRPKVTGSRLQKTKTGSCFRTQSPPCQGKAMNPPHHRHSTYHPLRFYIASVNKEPRPQRSSSPHRPTLLWTTARMTTSLCRLLLLPWAGRLRRGMTCFLVDPALGGKRDSLH